MADRSCGHMIVLAKRAIIAALLFLLSAPLACAQSTKAALTTQIGNCFPTQFVGAITPSNVVTCFDSLINSFQQYAGVNAQTGTSYTFQASDYGQLVTFNNSSSIAVALPQATGTFATFNVYASTLGSGTVTITPIISTINGASSLTLKTGQSVKIISDGTNYQVFALPQSTSLVVGSTTISGGAPGRIVYDNSGVVGELATTGSGNVVLASSPTLTTPNLGTPSAITLTNATGLPVSTGFSGTGTGVTTALATNVTGSGGIVLATSPSISNPTVTGSFTATGLVTNSDLANSSITVNGTSCVLGSSCAPTAAASSITEGTTSVTSGNAPEILANISGKVTGTGLSLATEPVINLTSVTPFSSAAGLGLRIFGGGATSLQGGMEVDGFGVSQGPSFFAQFADGTESSPSAVLNGHTMFALFVNGYNGSGYTTGTAGARFTCTASQNWAVGQNGTQCQFLTTPNNSSTPTTAVTIGQDQSLNVTGIYKANGTAGVSCAANTVNLTTFAVSNGIVTHC